MADWTLIGRKAHRLCYVMDLLYTHTNGFTSRELAERCGVDMRTMQRDLLDLQDEPFRVPLIREHERWMVLPGSRYWLPPIRFELAEATALFLAARLLCRYADENLPALSRSLERLSAALPGPIAEHVQRTAEAAHDKPSDARFEAVFSAITLGWARRRKVRIWHQAGNSEGVHERLLSPYFIEPSTIGYATYVIGHSSHVDAVRTFKIERIVRAELTDEPFAVPADFDALALLASAWGVMFGEELETVVLRFAPQVTRRVCESVWHPSQQIEGDSDGGCRLTVRVAEPMEMKPWIRGWGPDCVVEGPVWLREEIAKEMWKAAEGYWG